MFARLTSILKSVTSSPGDHPPSVESNTASSLHVDAQCCTSLAQEDVDDNPLCSASAFDEEEFVICSAEVDGQRSHIASSVECDAVFPSIESAKSAITEYACCPVLQTSRKKHEFVSFL